MYAAARSLLFRLDAERAHELTLETLRRAPALATLPFARAPVDDPVELLGLRFANRVGLAAGLDKNGECLRAWSRLGFGFVEIGTVTPRPQPGNPRPRMFRLPEHEAIINRLGFNNKGVDYLLERVAESDYRGVLGINIGKNADTPLERAVDDYRIGLERVYRHASYVAVNVSSPNTAKLRELQSHDALDELLDALCTRRDELAREHARRVPLALKIAPDLDDAQIEAIAGLLVRHRIDAVIATNTTISREAVAGLPNAAQSGGLSGAPVFEASNRVIRALRAALPAGYPIIGVGGILCADDARAKLVAGATLVQLYTGLIYRGPMLIGECARALRDATRVAARAE